MSCLTSLLALSLNVLAVDPSKPQEQWIVVAAPGLSDAVKPLSAFRTEQGFHVTQIDAPGVTQGDAHSNSPAAALREQIQDGCRSWKGPSYVLLVGAAASDGVQEPEKYVLPTLKGTTARMTGEPTDNGYGSPGASLVATVAVGRFPARNAEEARDMVAKTLAWERDKRPGEWKRRVTVLAGAPSFNPFVDSMVEKLAMSELNRLPPIWSGRAIYWNPNSPFTLPDESLRERTLDYLRRGQGLIVYLGHSTENGFWHGDQPDGRWGPGFTRDDWSGVRIVPGGGIFATFGCSGCRLRSPDGEGYGLYAMRNPHGPVALIGSHGICWAAMSMLFSEGLLSHLPDQGQSPRLGEVWLKMKKHLAEARLNPIVFRALDAVDGAPRTPEATQRLEHQEMFLLLGDPAIRFPALSSELSIEVIGHAAPGATLTVKSRVPPELLDAVGRLTLERPLTSSAAGLEPLPPASDSKKRADVMLTNHERANQFVLAESRVRSEGPSLSVELKVPAELSWSKLLIRLYLANDDNEGLAVKTVEVQRPTSTKAAD